MAFTEAPGVSGWIQGDFWRRQQQGELGCVTAPPGAWENLAQALTAQERRRRGPVLNLLSRLSTRTLSIADRVTNVAAWTIGGAGGVSSLLGLSYVLPERFNPLFGAWHSIAGIALLLAADHFSTANRVIRRELSHRK